MLRRMPSNLSAHVLILDMEMTTHWFTMISC
jgi:hypothetical protein